MIQHETLVKLRKFDTPTICNIIELFNIRPYNTGYMDKRIQACFPNLPPMVGCAATATFRAGGPPRSGEGYFGMVDQVKRFEELSGPPVVVFQDLDDPAVAATFGEIMCSTYQAFGAVGLITSGAGRDLQQVGAIQFPVFTNGTICSHGYVHFPQIHVPIHVGGIAIYPDDLLHGDINGVTTIPIEIADEVADVGNDFIKAENVVLAAMRESSPNPVLLQEALAESKSQIQNLKNRLSRSTR
jgi:4-hydroxy-4-methyl-2-oxoglutarate aldolase